MDKKALGPDLWVDKLSENDLPALASVLCELKNVVEDNEATAAQFSEIILKDASLTTQILKVANCAYYNPVSTPISTLSKAVVQLGTNAIKSICVSALVIEQFLQGGCRDRLLQLLANSFHTATQAKNLFELSGDKSVDAESVVIAGLLINLGEMAFWSFGGKHADELDQLISQQNKTVIECEKQVVGAPLKSLTHGLGAKWGLGKILSEALSDKPSDKPAVKALQTAKKLVKSIEAGWHSSEFEKTLDEITQHYDLDRDEAREFAMQGAEEAATVVLTYGANQLCHLIPSPADSQRADVSEPMSVDPVLQLNILRELGSMAEEKVDLNTLFQTVLEGLHRGVGLERVAIALVNSDQSTLTAKYVIRKVATDWEEKFSIPLDSKESVFNECINKRELVIVERADRKTGKELSPKERSLLDNKGDAIMAPILIGQRLLGVYYADRGDTGEDLDQARKEGFQHFSQQANMCLALMAEKR